MNFMHTAVSALEANGLAVFAYLVASFMALAACALRDDRRPSTAAFGAAAAVNFGLAIVVGVAFGLAHLADDVAWRAVDWSRTLECVAGALVGLVVVAGLVRSVLAEADQAVKERVGGLG